MAAFGVLFVCVGNICRSPYAERLLRLRLEQAGAASGDFSVTSAGTWAPVGSAMHPEMARRLVDRGGDPDGFAARQVQEALLNDAGLVVAATKDLRSRLLQEAPGALRRTFTLLELAHLAADLPPGLGLGEAIRSCSERRSSVRAEDYDLVDPIRASPAVFDEVAEKIDVALGPVVRLLSGHAPDDWSGTADGTRIAP